MNDRAFHDLAAKKRSQLQSHFPTFFDVFIPCHRDRDQDTPSLPRPRLPRRASREPSIIPFARETLMNARNARDIPI